MVRNYWIKCEFCQVQLAQPNGQINRVAPETMVVFEAFVGAAPVQRVLGIAY
jgi:hypothetical protein